jgi:hypothetical protein
MNTYPALGDALREYLALRRALGFQARRRWQATRPVHRLPQRTQ